MNEWTTTTPTQGGLWWAYDGKEVIPVDLYFSEFNRLTGCAGLLAYELGEYYGLGVTLDSFTHWMGPLTPPAPPMEPTP